MILHYEDGTGVEITTSKTTMEEFLNGKSAKPKLKWFRWKNKGE